MLKIRTSIEITTKNDPIMMPAIARPFPALPDLLTLISPTMLSITPIKEVKAQQNIPDIEHTKPAIHMLSNCVPFVWAGFELYVYSGGTYSELLG